MSSTSLGETKEYQWAIDGKDGQSILLVNELDDPDTSDAQYLRVFGPGKEALAADVARKLNAHDELVQLVREFVLHQHQGGAISATVAAAEIRLAALSGGSNETSMHTSSPVRVGSEPGLAEDSSLFGENKGGHAEMDEIGRLLPAERKPRMKP